MQSFAEFTAGLAASCDGLSARLSVGEDENGIVGAHVAIDTDAIEGSFHRLEQ